MNDNASKSEMQDSPDMFYDSQECAMEVDSLRRKPDRDKPSWRGAPMSVIYKGQTPWDAPEFPAVVPGYRHTVLFHVPSSTGSVYPNTVPSPQKGKDVWDRNHVRMPCSSQSLYPVEENGKTVLKNRWELIVNALRKPIKNPNELEAAILEYNSKYKKFWKFNALSKLFEEYLEEEETEHFFNKTLPKIQNLVLKLPEIIPSAIPLLRQSQNRSISLSQWQVACLLANAFFCTFPRRNSRKSGSEYYSFPDINFNRLFQSGGSKNVMEKLKCICHYFRRIFDKVPTGVITFSRHCIEDKKFPEWSDMNALLNSIPLHVDSNGTIEDDGKGLLQVDFANKYLGGGVLNLGCVQEEIRFVVCPELLASMLFTEVLESNEAVSIIGCERFSNYTGYSTTFKWESNHIDRTPKDSSGRLRCAVLAIDATCFYNPLHQYQPKFILRELNKAYCGYSIYTSPSNNTLSLPGVATGNWGCGAFCGSPHLKALIQLIACCAARRPMVYFTFGDEELKEDIINVYNFLSENKITIGQLYSYINEFYKSSMAGDNLFPFILQIHNDKEKQSNTKMKATASSPKDSKLDNFNKSGKRDDLNKRDENVDVEEILLDSYKSTPNGDEEKKAQNPQPNTSQMSFFDSVTYVSEVSEHAVKVEVKKMKIEQKTSLVTNDKEKAETSIINTVKKSSKISDYFQPIHKK